MVKRPRQWAHVIEMSGLVFSFLLGALALGALDAALRELGLVRTDERNLWRGYVEEEGRKYPVLLEGDGEEVRLVIPDKRLSRDKCKKIAERLAKELYQLVVGRPPDRVRFTMKDVGNACHYCLRHVEGMLFRCNLCGGLFCADHRLPEDHDCPGGDKMVSRIPITLKEMEEESRGELIIREAPCG